MVVLFVGFGYAVIVNLDNGFSGLLQIIEGVFDAF